MGKVYVFGYSEGGLIQTLRASTNYGYLLAIMYLRAERDSFDYKNDDARISTANGEEIYSYQHDLGFLDFEQEFSNLPLHNEVDNTLLVFQYPEKNFGYITVSNEDWKPINELSGSGYDTREEVLEEIKQLTKTNRIGRIEVIPSKEEIE